MDTIALNTWPALALIQAALAHGLADGGGSVVNISSGSPRKTTPSMVAYAAAKAALNTLTRTIAADLGPRGVRVNAVSPGLTKTTATKPMWEQDDGRGAGANLILGRLTEADDIAAAAAFTSVMAFEQGGIVPETAMAMVHKNEMVLPAGIAQALLANNSSGGGNTHYHIDARGADAGVEQRIHRAIRESEQRAVARSVGVMQDRASRSR